MLAKRSVSAKMKGDNRLKKSLSAEKTNGNIFIVVHFDKVQKFDNS